MTQGVHHVGLTTRTLHETEQFFTIALGWNVVTRDDEYPATFVGDGPILITLWQSSDSANNFDRKLNVGLHHLALAVERMRVRTSLMKYLKVNISSRNGHCFSPELLREGPAKHMMCFEPGDIKIEFIYVPKQI